jgi:hypothetical protein
MGPIGPVCQKNPIVRYQLNPAQHGETLRPYEVARASFGTRMSSLIESPAAITRLPS